MLVAPNGVHTTPIWRPGYALGGGPTPRGSTPPHPPTLRLAGLGLGALAVAQVFSKVLSLTAGLQGPGGPQEIVQSSPTRSEYRIGASRQKQRIQVRRITVMSMTTVRPHSCPRG